MAKKIRKPVVRKTKKFDPSKAQKSNMSDLKKNVTLKCSKCGKPVKGCNPEAVATTCAICVAKMIPGPVIRTESTKLQGWKMMKVFVDADGTVYHMGEEQPELHGTLEPTPVEKIKKERAAKRAEKKSMIKRQNKFFQNENELKNTIELAKEYKKKQKLKKKLKLTK